MKCDVGLCDNEATMLIAFDGQDRPYPYCDRHDRTWQTKPRVMWPRAQRQWLVPDDDVF